MKTIISLAAAASDISLYGAFREVRQTISLSRYKRRRFVSTHQQRPWRSWAMGPAASAASATPQPVAATLSCSHSVYNTLRCCKSRRLADDTRAMLARSSLLWPLSSKIPVVIATDKPSRQIKLPRANVVDKCAAAPRSASCIYCVTSH